jgi:folate-binding protein YgfZ
MFSEEGYRALTTGAGVVRRGDRGVLTVSGPDRLTWLQGLVTNDVTALPVKGVCYAAYLTAQGRMITDLRVINLADRTLLDVPAPLAASLQARLDALLFSEDAAIADSSRDLTIVDVHGPLAINVVEGLDAVRDDAFDLPGFSAVVAPHGADALIAELVGRDAIETTLETLDVVRIEAGRPAFLVDMDEHTIPLEAGLEERAISFSKGCYIGQEIIVRVTQRGGGRVAKKLVGLRLAKSELPKAGDTIRVGDRPIGRLTSVAWSPAISAAVALGYVHRDFAAPGTSVEVDGRAGTVAATVTALPFVPRAAASSART